MPITADPVVVAQVFEPEAKVDLVTSATVNMAGNVYLPTPTGSNDQRMAYVDFVDWLAGDGIKQAGVKFALDIGGLANAASAVGTDLIAIETAAGVRHITRDALLVGVVPGTDLGHQINADASIEITSSTGGSTTILIANGSRDGFLSRSDHALFSGKLDQVDITAAYNANEITVGTDTPGASVNLGESDGVQAGIVTAGNYNDWNAKLDRVNLGVSPSDPNVVSITNDSGDDSGPLPLASATQAGVLSRDDWQAFNAGAGGGGVDLSTTYAPTGDTFTIVNSGGNDAQVNAATSTMAGAYPAADFLKLQGIEAQANKYVHPDHGGAILPVNPGTGDGNYVLGPQVVGTNNLQTNSVDNNAVAPDAIETVNIKSGQVTEGRLATGAVTNDKVQDGTLQRVKLAAAPAGTLLGNAQGVTADVADLAVGDLPVGTADPTDVAVCYTAAGGLVKNALSAITGTQTRKEIYDDLGDVGAGTLVIDFDDPSPANTGDNKYMQLTGDPDLDIRGARPGRYKIWFKQDAGGNNQPRVISAMSPAFLPKIDTTGGSWSLVVFEVDPDGGWHW